MSIINVFYVTHLHLQLKCCGMNSSADWRSFKPDGNSVPDSCCVNVTTGCGNGTMKDSVKVHQEVQETLSNQCFYFEHVIAAVGLSGLVYDEQYVFRVLW